MSDTTQLTPLAADPAHTELAVALYTEAFPESERRSAAEWRAQLQRGAPFHAEAITEHGQFCGFVSHWQLGGLTYVEHFATLPSLRGQGTGSRALRLLMQRHTPLILEVEPPTDDMARRRIAFYRRHGLRLLSRPYLQPPYRTGGTPLPLCLMTSAPQLTAGQLDAAIGAIHRHVYGVASPLLP